MVHHKYEFGTKVSVASLSGSNVVVGIANFVGNPHDAKTLAPTLDQVVQWTGRRYERVLLDKGYRGHGQVGTSAVIILGKKAHAGAYVLRRHMTLCKATIRHRSHYRPLGKRAQAGQKLSQGKCRKHS